MARILFIDDEENIRDIMKHHLGSVGHEVIEASDGHIGLQIFNEQGADLIITDVIMEHSGIDLIKTIRESNTKIPIIAITGSHLAKASVQAGLPVSAVLVKPIEKTDLINEVNRLIGRE